MISRNNMWTALQQQHAQTTHVMAANGCDTQPIPESAFSIMCRSLELAEERRPLTLHEYRKFWDDALDDAFISLNILDEALASRSAGPLRLEDRAFLDHWRQCVSYLASQGFQGIVDERDHWGVVELRQQ